ncbi:MAG: HAMP domain-containing histidine kinase [Lachnospiraceae bacterium]|nr:HAMP domain-containing histidine kinase [Lachnospiraceae bacterium]
MDTSSKNKNKLRWFIGIIVGIIVTVGACLAMQFILAAKESVGDFAWTERYDYTGMREYVKYINGQPIHYMTTTQSDVFGIVLGEELAGVLAKYGEVLLFAGMIFCMFLLVCFLRCERIWKHTENPHRKGIAYVAELLVVALCCLPAVYYEYSWYYDNFYIWQRYSSNDWVGMIEYAIDLSYPIVEMLVYFFVCLWFIRPVFKLGLKQYLREYSLLCLIGRGFRKVWRTFKEELDAMDFSKKPIRVLGISVLIQFGILFLCVCCWFVGIPLLILYSLALFFFLNRQYKKAESGYSAVLREVEGIARGDLNGTAEGDFGMFRPLGTGLTTIKDGFRKAVEEEVKSERMKTELITNVSHDLKTPLTAILTYVELLKQENLTAEERDSYIGTLEQKSHRLKVLIEDLFEVSRAASNNIELFRTEVDLVKLIKQVAVEHEEQFAEAVLTLRQTMPGDICKVYVDGQKTYRIFENLFSNICKYAMPGSRVYVRVYEKMGWYYAELKNMSAMELTVAAEELTERFVRGDSSRNTEGSGLGLAIAKSLTTLQGGSFRIETDGDLFKVELGFPQVMYVEEKAEKEDSERNIEPQDVEMEAEEEIEVFHETSEDGEEESDSEEQKAECDSEEWAVQEEDKQE